MYNSFLECLLYYYAPHRMLSKLRIKESSSECLGGLELPVEERSRAQSCDRTLDYCDPGVAQVKGLTLQLSRKYQERKETATLTNFIPKAVNCPERTKWCPLISPFGDVSCQRLRLLDHIVILS